MTRQELIRLAKECGLGNECLSNEDNVVIDCGDSTAEVLKFASAVARAERRMWADAFDSMKEKIIAKQTGPSHLVENVMLRQVAEIGMGQCAWALRELDSLLASKEAADE